jgi:hypothetical protein
VGIVDITLPNCVLMTLAAVAVSIGGMLLVRRNVSLENLRAHHDVTDPLLAVLGTLFAILLGFMLANSMQRFEEVRLNAQQEAGATGDLFRLADGLPPQLKEKTRADCLKYLNLVIKEEWPLMQQGKLSDQTWDVYGDLWQDCLHYDPQTQGQSNIHQALVGAISKTGECRRARAAQLSYGLPSTLWIVVLFGGLTTISFTYFFAVDNVRLQMLMTSVITMIVCLNIYMLAGFDAPFSGDIHITSAAYQSTLDSLIRVQNKQAH